MVTVSDLLSGLIGSVVAALLTFAAAVWTIRATRHADTKRAARGAAERDLERRELVVARVIGTIKDLETEIRWAPFLQGRYTARLLEACMTFYLSQHRDHPLVATWLVTQYEEFEKTIGRWRRVSWMPKVGGKRAEAMSLDFGHLGGVLVAWATQQLDDGDFANATTPPRDIVERAQLSKPRAA